MKILSQIPILFLLLCMYSFKMTAAEAPVFSSDNVEVWVHNVCQEGSSSGKIDLRILSEFGPFQVIYYDENQNELKNVEVIAGNAGEEDLDALAVGNYIIKIIDSQCAVANLEVNIEILPAMEINADLSLVCQVGAGIIVPEITGGEEPYTYLWSNGKTTRIINNLEAGTYTLTVTYGNGCSSEESFEVEYVENPIQIDESIVNPCNGATGSIDLQISGGNEPFTVEWYKKAPLGTPFPMHLVKKTQVTDNSGNEDLNNISSGKYLVIIKGSDGCQAIKYFDIQNQDIDVDVETFYDCQKGLVNKIMANVTGGEGTMEYNWQWNQENSSPQYYTTLVPTLNRALIQHGDYTVTVTDSRGCKSMRDFYYGPLTVEISDPSYICSTSGIVLKPSVKGGNTPYTFLWNTGQTTEYIEGIVDEGDYVVTVTDNGSCWVVKGIEVKYWVEKTLGFNVFYPGIPTDDGIGYCVKPQSCACDGRIEVSGTALNWPPSNYPYEEHAEYWSKQLLWEKIGSSEIPRLSEARPAILDLCEGVYRVTTKDACPITREINLTSQPCATRIDLVKLEDTCDCLSEDCFGSISINILTKSLSTNIKWFKCNTPQN